ncbi:MAG TPA: VOC family protein [Lapillicoccus sp.]|uniref:VOC family protein n=1 Tax=Lapillicoccus sp. TaxID=1909287 RepID=UPI002F95F2A8
MSTVANSRTPGSLPPLGLLSVKIPVADLTSSRAWYAEVFGLTVELEWPDADGVVRGVGFAPIGGVMIALREHPEAAAATKNFGFLNISVPREDDLAACAEHLDQLAIPHTPVINGATGRLIGFHDPDRHELSFYAGSGTGARSDALRHVRDARAEEASR